MFRVQTMGLVAIHTAPVRDGGVDWDQGLGAEHRCHIFGTSDFLKHYCKVILLDSFIIMDVVR